ncbi:MAG: GNAT family protein [Chloroflexi bacterium]|nr:GNAT family protein [Chloroflexota bacterium]MDA1004313.1 GNAT family protein [Chloroflexota bacterium]
MAEPEARSPADQRPIEGPRVRFRPVVDADLPDIVRWLSEPEVVRFYGDPPASIADAWDDYVEPDDTSPTWRFVIEVDGRGVGEIQYSHAYPGREYEWSAGIDIFIGEGEARNRGIGTEAIRTMLAFLFEQKHVHRVTIDPEVSNRRAIRCYEKAGFRLDGVLRHNFFEHGEYVDTHFMSMLEDDWPAAKARWEAEPSPRTGGAGALESGTEP